VFVDGDFTLVDDVDVVDVFDDVYEVVVEVSNFVDFVVDIVVVKLDFLTATAAVVSAGCC
jgi:hypothetical protein